MRKETRIILASIALGIILWIGDAAANAIFYPQKSFVKAILLEATPHDIFVRSIIFLTLSFLGVATALLIRRETYARKKLEESEKRYRDLVEHSVDMIIIHDLAGRILTCNRTAIEVLELESVEKTIGMDLRNIVVPKFRDNFKEYLKDIKQDGRIKGYMKVLTGSGKTRILEFENTYNEDGNNSFVRGRAQDVTEKLAMEKALRESEARYRELFERNLAGVYKTTLEGKIIECNQSMVDIFGYRNISELMEHNTADLYPDPLKRLNFIETLKRDGRASNLEQNLRKADGTEIKVLINALLVKDRKYGQLIEGTLLDITEREALAREKARAGELKAIAGLTAGIAHEVRNPIFAIQLNFEALKRHLTLDEKADKQMGYVFSHLSRLDALSKNLMELGQSIQSEELSEIEVSVLLTTACLQMKEENPAFADKLELTIPDSLPVIKVAPLKVIHALVHILRNAMEVTPHDGVIRIRCKHDDKACKITISDEGPGISKDIADPLFEPFFTTKTGKTGMGLALARHYILLHGGRIKARNNEDGPGAAFTVTLPI